MILLQQLIWKSLTFITDICWPFNIFIRFPWNSLIYEFSIVLPFGLASDPRVFTNLVKPSLLSLIYADNPAIRIIIFLDTLRFLAILLPIVHKIYLQ
jgi:hypothetical protein